MYTFFAVIIFTVLAWWIRGKIEMKKSAQYLEARQKVRESAKKAINQIKIFYPQKLMTPEDLESIDRLGFNNLIDLRKSSALDEIDITDNEAGQLLEFIWMHWSWYSLVDDLENPRYDSVEDNLKKRDDFLKKHQKTLSDFGIDHDNADELKKAYHLSLAKSKANDAFPHLIKAREKLTSFKKELRLAQCEYKDFPLTEEARILFNLILSNKEN